MKQPFAWTKGDTRIWWACPTCKVEGGATPPMPLSELVARMTKFLDEHNTCANTTVGRSLWQRSEQSS